MNYLAVGFGGFFTSQKPAILTGVCRRFMPIMAIINKLPAPSEQTKPDTRAFAVASVAVLALVTALTACNSPWK